MTTKKAPVKPVPVKCDNCTNKFKIKKLKMKPMGDYQGQPVTAKFFSCPRCKTNYLVTLETPRILELVGGMKAAQQKYEILAAKAQKEKSFDANKGELLGLLNQVEEYKRFIAMTERQLRLNIKFE